MLIGLVFPWFLSAQSLKPTAPGSKRDTLQRTLTEPPDWLSAGMMEWGQGGQLQASAPVVRLLIGEPGKWQLPLSVYSGVTQPGSNAVMGMVNGSRSNESITWQLYSPWSGMMNVGFEGQKLCSNWGSYSALRMVFQAGERVLSGYRVGALNDPLTGKQQFLWNHYAVFGWVIHTGAWERSNPKNLGRGWLMVRGHLSYSAPEQLRGLFSLRDFRGLYGGASLGLGIEVSRVVHLRAGVCWPVHGPEWSPLRSLAQFSFQYNWKS
ncbi:MAG: hypothetical protein FJX92_04880 [Bacteroidetes bacterium]|nr:hypothetical protein [Bacteroidota bacterium]